MYENTFRSAKINLKSFNSGWMKIDLSLKYPGAANVQTNKPIAELSGWLQ